MKLIFFIWLIFGFLTLFGTTVEAQEEISRPPLRDVVKRKLKPSVAVAPKPKIKPKPKKVYVPQTVTAKRETKTISVKTGNLVISTTETSAEITLQSSVPGATPRTKTIPEEGTVQWENLSPGKYTVTATLDGFDSQEVDVELLAQKTVSLNLDLKPITYQIIIETNVNDGEVRYAPLGIVGRNAKGDLKTGETGGYCYVPIKNGKAQIKELKKGTYNLDIQGGVEYKNTVTKMTLPNDIADDNGEVADEPSVISIDLERQQSTTTFGTAWSNSEWNFPAGWKMENNSLKTSGLPGVALPGNELYRHYIDFEMISNVRLLNEGTAGFIVRALNDQNYYLVQISGAKAAEPYQMQIFVVKKGKAEPLSSSSVQTFASTLAANFSIIIKGEKNVFTVFIEDREKGEYVPLGKITDPGSNFNKGAIGIAGQQNSNFQVYTFKVCTPVCSEAER